jgi:hypothetical protein
VTQRLHPAPGAPLGLEEFVAAIEATVDFREPDSLCDAAGLLQRLAANPDFLGDWLLAELQQRGDGFQAGNFYNYQSLVLRVTDDYLLRANFWLPEKGLRRLSAHERLAFGYDVAHNHNFHLLTAGHCGSGYETDLFHCPDPWREYEIGEAVLLEPRGRERLATGDMMFYRAYEDVHAQIAPETFSVSLNLMTHSARAAVPQYVFDTAAGRIAARVDSPLDARVHVASLARLLLPDAAEAVLHDIARRDPSPRLRALARDALAGTG